MKIMMIARGYPSKKYPLNGIFELDQAKALVAIGHQVCLSVIDLRSLRRWRTWGYEQKYIDGVVIHALNIPCGRIPLKWLYRIGGAGIKRLYKRVVKLWGVPEVIHSHFTDISIMTSQAFIGIDIPMIMTEHSSAIIEKAMKRFEKEKTKTMYQSMARVIAVSNSLAKIIHDEYKIVPIVIPNILDIEAIEPNDGPDKKNEQIFRFISVGNLVKVKNMDVLIRGFSQCFCGKKDVQLIIVGEGPERPLLENMIRDFKMEDQIQLLGLKTRYEIGGYLKAANCFVLVSQAETFGVAFIEALALGIPVIATTCGGPEDFVNESNGILIPKKDINALEKALYDIYIGKIKYENNRIAKETKERFSSYNVGKQIEKIYDSVQSDYQKELMR